MKNELNSQDIQSNQLDGEDERQSVKSEQNEKNDLQQKESLISQSQEEDSNQENENEVEQKNENEIEEEKESKGEGEEERDDENNDNKEEASESHFHQQITERKGEQEQIEELLQSKSIISDMENQISVPNKKRVRIKNVKGSETINLLDPSNQIGNNKNNEESEEDEEEVKEEYLDEVLNEIGETPSQRIIREAEEKKEAQKLFEQEESQKVATFYGRESDRFNFKIIIYLVLHALDVSLKILACAQFHQNGMNDYMAAQIIFIVFERIAKVALFSTLNIYRLFAFNLFFMDYLAILQYQEIRKMIRNYNLYNVIVKRIDLLIASKLIEATLLSGPSLFITLYASINGYGDRFNFGYVLSALASLGTIIFANLEILDFQLVQCKFNSITNAVRIQFEQNFGNLLRDLTIVLINIASQAGFWMLGSQISGFVIAHAFVSYLYILGVTSVIAYFSLTRENLKVLQEKNSLNIRKTSVALSLIIALFLFIMIYCMFFFFRLKKRLYQFLLANTIVQNNQLFADIAMIHVHYKDDHELFTQTEEIRKKKSSQFHQSPLKKAQSQAEHKKSHSYQEDKEINIEKQSNFPSAIREQQSQFEETPQNTNRKSNMPSNNNLIENALKKNYPEITKLKQRQSNAEFFQKKRTTLKDFQLPKKGILQKVPEQVVYADYKFYHFSLAFKGITAFRVFCIFNIIGLILVDVFLNKPDQYQIIRVISYCCSIIVFFHLFQLKRDLSLFLLIKQERIQYIYLQKLLKKVKLPFNQMIKLRLNYQYILSPSAPSSPKNVNKNIEQLLEPPPEAQREQKDNLSIPQLNKIVISQEIS